MQPSMANFAFLKEATVQMHSLSDTDDRLQRNQQQLKYWLQQLETSKPAEIPCDKPRPAVLSGRVKQVDLEGEVYHKVQNFCQKRDVAPSIVLLAAFRAAHYRLTNSTDATVGVKNAKRHLQGTRDAIDLSEHTQCLRIRLEHESFQDLVQQVQETTRDAIAHQDAPFDKIASELGRDRDASRHPLTQILFALHPQQIIDRVSAEELKTTAIESTSGPRFDLELHCYQKDGTLRVVALYAEELYHPETITNMLSVFIKMVEGCLSYPDRAIASLSLMNRQDHDQLDNMGLLHLVRTGDNRDSSIIDIFHEQVVKFPDKLAVKDSSTQLTYRQLDHESDLIAQWLLDRRLPTETLIAVFASRSCETIMAFLGILKANMAYLPLDTRTPKLRLNAIMCWMAVPRLVLVGSDMIAPEAHMEGVEFVPVSETHRTIKDDMVVDKVRITMNSPRATSLAYVMFTSGSTGQPKGVMVEHRSVVQLVKSNLMQQIPSSPTIAHLSNIAFDAATWDIYAALLNGGTIICIDHMTTIDTELIAKTFKRERINHAFLTTALFKQYIRECPALLSTMDTICVGGDRVDPQDVSAFRKIGKCKFINVYGPTENTTFSTMYCLDSSIEGSCPNNIPIGRAMSNSGAYVMDAHLGLVPLGVVGELVLTGDGLARGYTDAQLNIGRFISVSIAGQKVRGYLTGDLVRYRPVDGQLEFLGRLDGQVKVRGHRVELGEIENVLLTHEHVTDAIVILQSTADDTDLAGFVSLHHPDPVSDPDERSNDETKDPNTEHVEMWENSFDADTYKTIGNLQRDTIGRDFLGWTSMYDGNNIDKEEMNEWLDDTINTIVNGGQPRHIVEIGSGTGMLLFNLTEGLESYVGLEPSEKAVDFVTRAAMSTPALSNKVRICKGTAMDIRKLEGTLSPETLVIVNSVAQYFPSQQYLLNLIETIFNQLQDATTIFFGDIRSHALHKQFLATKAIHLLGENATRKSILQKVTEMAENELELLVDPAFFTSLVDMFPGRIKHVEIIPKRMNATNELSCYRYCAVLHVASSNSLHQLQIHEIPVEDWVDYSWQGLDRQSLFQLLQKQPENSVLAVSNIPYSKTILERHVVSSIEKIRGEEKQPDNTPDWLSSVRQASASCPSLSPVNLVELSQKAGCTVEISWARQFSQQGALDVVFHRQRPSSSQRTLFNFPSDHRGRSLRSLSSHPWLQHVKQKVRDELYETMQARLPPYMIPRTVTILDKIPVNENGKIDRNALANMKQQQRPQVRQAFRKPVSEAERQMQKLWGKVLNIDASSIGLDDSFFQLGGTSITVMRVISEARASGRVISVAQIFRNPSLEFTAGNASTIIEESQALEPFSLLPDDVDPSLFLKDISTRYQLSPSAILDAYPCTPLQEGLLSLTLKRPGDYISQAPMRITSDMSVEKVQHAWEEVVQATPILRTIVIQHGTGLLQVVLKEHIVWAKSDSLQDYLETDRKRSIDFGQPLARYALITDKDDSVQWLVWTIHHALFDGWSMSLIMDSINNAFDGKPIAKSPPFSSFIKYVKEQDDAAITNYWRTYLEICDDCVPFPALPPSLTEPKTDTVIEHRLPQVHIQNLDVTISSVIRGAWALIAGQMTDSSNVLFGVTLFGRNAPVANIEQMSAPTFATVPVCIQLKRQQRVRDYLEEIHRQATEMIPFEQTGLNRIAKIAATCQQACQFQTLLLVQAQENMPETISGKKLSFDWQPDKSNQEQWFNPYAMMIEIHIGTEELVAKASFDSRIIQPGVVRSLLNRFEYAIQQLSSASRDQTIGEIKLLSMQDVQQIWEWNRSVPPPVERCVTDLIAEQVAARPHAPAVCAWDGELTYRELDQLSTVVSRQLILSGVQSDMLIPLCFEKSMWTPVVMLGVLKAGGAFVLLESSLPEKRLERIVRQLGTNLILSSKSNADLSSRLAKVVMQVSGETIHASSWSDNTMSGTQVQSPSATAFAVFTSGSTGVPKGVMLSHSQFASSMAYQSGVLGFEQDSRVFDFASYAFDIAVHNAIAAFTNGACLCIPSDHDRKNNIAAVMASMRVTIANLTPSVARLIDPKSVTSLKTLILAGEAVSKDDGQRLWDTSIRVINAYGPAECTISTINATASTPDDISNIGIGYGVVTWVVDPDDHDILLPRGCVGELLLEGPPVCRGYLGDSDKTSSMFIHDPKWLLEGSPGHAVGRHGRLYKTSDLVRYRDDGSLVFMGRKDTQVKIRGQRVELGEIEHCILRCMPGVSRVVAEVIPASEGKSRPILAAFFETGQLSEICELSEESGDELQMFPIPQEVERQMLLVLPRYMLPDAFFSLRQLPHTMTGKINRKLIRNLAVAASPRQLAKPTTVLQTKRQPTTQAEQQMRQIWANVLDVDDHTLIGLDDSFFALGGNSIDAMKVVGEARNVGFDLTVAHIFRSPILHQLTDQISSASSQKPVSIPRQLESGPMEQSFAQGRLWFIEQLHPGLSWYIMPCAIRLRGLVRLQALHAALLALENRHETLRTTFFSDHGVNKQQAHPFKPKQLRIVDIQPGNDEELLMQALKAEQDTPFDLTKDPGWRVCVYRLGNDHYVLSIIMHHIISDGWSLDILRSELATFYSASIRGSRDSLLLQEVEDLPIQYRDYSVWQRRQNQGDDYQRQLDYWLQYLEASRPAEFLCDKPRPASLSGRAGVQQLKIEGPLYEELQRFCKLSDVTIFTVLLAAFRAAHYRLTAVSDAVFGCPNANRDRWEVKNLIGFFMNLQCIRIKVEEDSSFRDLVHQVHLAMSDSFANQDVPFESIVSRLQKERDLSRSPLAQVTFILHSQQDLGKFYLEGIDTESLAVDMNSRFDIEFHIFQEVDDLRGEIIFSEDLYEIPTIQVIISTFLKALNRGIREPDTEIASLPLWESEDYSALQDLGLFQDKRTDYPRDSNIVDVFRQQVTANPHKIAVKDSGMELTYSQLNLKSDDMAEWLRKQSLEREALIGILATRSCENIVAILGILKANLAYLPFDPQTPAGRMEKILSTIDGKRIVLLGAGVQVPSIQLEDIRFITIAEILHARPGNHTNGWHNQANLTSPGPNSLAYVMFTSGSTGQPKGVMIEHRGILRLVKNSDMIHHRPDMGVMAHMANLAFDVSTWEIYVTLLNGGTLVCVDSTMVLEHTQLPELFRREDIRFALFTPALLEQYLLACPTILTQLESLYLGGDTFQPQTLRAARKFMTGKIINAYGPTENTGASTSYCIPEDDLCTNGVPIGRSLSNSGAYVMDNQQRLVPLGVLGELIVTGDGLARGYTDPKHGHSFISIQVYGKQVNAYRTGDCARYRPSDGQLELFGRMDRQVKIRGNRIELAEIEHALRSHKIVSTAAVVHIEPGVGSEAQLAGFVSLETANDQELISSEKHGRGDEDDENKQVKVWENLFDSDTYNDIKTIVPAGRIGRDYSGWVSMYNGEDIPATEMDEWLDDAIATMLNGGPPGDVLELGTGTGMILFNLIEGLTSYFGLDPSKKAVDFLQQNLASMPETAGKVRVHRGTASDISRFRASMTPKLVVINSVAQYFPSQQYLLDVIESILRLGSVQRIFLGDVRSFALRQQFQVTKAVHRLGTQGVSQNAIREEMDRNERSEMELLLDPGFFTGLQDQVRFSSHIEHVEILPKKMRATNELSCYRYAAVIHAKVHNHPPRQVRDISMDRWIDFTGQKLTQESLVRLLEKKSASSESPVVALSNIPHSKTIWERCAVAFLDANNKDSLSNESDWLSSIQRMADGCSSLSAMDLIDAAQQTGYRVEISWARQSSQNGSLDAVFHHFQPQNEESRVLFRFLTDHKGRQSHNLSNQPLQHQMEQRIIIQLKELLQTQLPTYMIPRTISVLKKLPINANGKVDRRALARIIKARGDSPTMQGPLRQPTSDVERVMRDIWADVLSREAVTIGLDDNFFLLGGDSITAMMLVSKARIADLHLTVADIFRNPTLEQLGSHAQLIFPSDSPYNDLEPFSLLPKETNVQSFLHSISVEYQLSSSAIQDAYPCTPLQEGLVSLTSKRPGDYVMQEVIELPVDISIPAFQKAWTVVFKAMPILRTRIVRDGDFGFLQIVMDEEINWMEARDLKSILTSDRNLSMELGQPLVRFALIYDNSGAARQFVWTMHHSVYDGWSFGLLMEAFHKAYSGNPVVTGPPFPAFIKHIADQDPEQAARYWSRELGNGESASFPPLPPSVQQPVSDKVIKHQFQCSHEISSGITRALILRAAWALISGQESNSQDTIFGVTLSGRNAPIADIDRLAAPTFATVPVRIQWDRDMKVLDYLHMVQQQATDMTAFEQTGLHRIARVSPDCQQACMFQTLLVIQTQKLSNAESGSASLLSTSENDNQQQRRFNPYALMLEVQLNGSEVMAKVSFDSRVLGEDAIYRVLDRLSHVMRQLESATASHTLAGIQMVSPSDLQDIWRWNKKCPKSIDRCVHDIISERVATHPDALAIHAWDGDLTYAQLDRLSETLAEHLGVAEIGPGSLVPVCFEKSMWNSVAILGILKTGGAFVLLDPSLPEQRLRIIVQQTKSQLIVSSAANQNLGSRLSQRVVVVAPDSSSIRNFGASLPRRNKPPHAKASPSTVMCAVFTSGSTGKPKGAMLTHANFASGLYYQVDLLKGFTDKSRVFDFASYAFDIAIHNFVATLATGGCLCVPSDEQRKGNIVETMAAMRVTTADLTPSVARLIEPEMVPSLKTLILAGEAVSIGDVARWLERKAPVHVINAYGPAECGISTISRDYATPEHLLSIGKGAGLVTWVVDPQNHEQLVGLGCPGELLLEGPLVGTGYLQEAEKTRESFLENPPSWLVRGALGVSGRRSRLYKTGDLVRYDEDGSLIFLGRKDSQVKIRGQRVELEEVEHWVFECMPEAKRVAVEVIIPDKQAAAAPLLVAFLEPTQEPSLKTRPAQVLSISTDVRDRLRLQLPNYMIPTAFLSIPEIPLTATLKTDRTRLREIGKAWISSIVAEHGRAHMQPLGVDKNVDILILETEQPAYELGQRVLSLSTLWGSESSSQPAQNGTGRHETSITNMMLHSCGLDSVNMMSLKYHISKYYKVYVSMQLLIDRETSIRTLAKFIKAAQEDQAANGSQATMPNQQSSLVDLRTEISRCDKFIKREAYNVQDQAIWKQTAESLGLLPLKPHKPQKVFLTGANGFIGTQILRQLLRHLEFDRVIVLVRGKTKDMALSRTIQAAKRAQWWTDDHLGRLTVWKGDLSQARLGLDQENWNLLANDPAINTIIHNGAVVHWGKTYADLYAANVASTAALLSLVIAHPAKKLIYVTGGQESIFKDGEEGIMAERLSAEGIIGYTQTKFVAEALVRRAARRDLSSSCRFIVASPGLVIGTPDEGVANADDYLWRLAAACIKAGAYDDDTANLWFNVADVATVATTIVDAALNSISVQQRRSEVTQVKGGMKWGHFWECLREMGYKLEPRSASEWLSVVLEELDKEREEHPLWPIAHMIQGEGSSRGHGGVDEQNISQRCEDESNSVSVSTLKKAVVKSAEFLGQLGYLPLPGGIMGDTKVEIEVDQQGEAFLRSGL